MRKIALSALVCFMVCLFFAPASASSVSSDFTDKFESIVNILNDDREQEDKAREVREILDSVMYWEKTAAVALGRDWRSLGPAQRQEYTRLFADLIFLVYYRNISGSTDQVRLVVDGEKQLNSGTIQLDTTIIAGNKRIPVTYRFALNNGQWQVYNIYIEGVSLAGNYRTQFSQIIRDGGFGKLKRMLEQKIDQLSLKDPEAGAADSQNYLIRLMFFLRSIE